jgi:hypothetical protein
MHLRIKKSFVSEISWSAFSKEPFAKKQVHDEVEEIEIDKSHKRSVVENKIHPMLKNIIAKKQTDSNDKKQQIIINFRDDLILPRFPEPRFN